VTTHQQRLHDGMVRRNYSPTTIRSYYTPHAAGSSIIAAIGLIGWAPTSSADQASLFKDKKMAVGTVGLHVAALRFFFVRVLKRRELKEELPTPKRARHLR
jgi:integrase/recombinase XerD